MRIEVRLREDYMKGMTYYNGEFHKDFLKNLQKYTEAEVRVYKENEYEIAFKDCEITFFLTEKYFEFRNEEDRERLIKEYTIKEIIE